MIVSKIVTLFVTLGVTKATMQFDTFDVQRRVSVSENRMTHPIKTGGKMKKLHEIQIARLCLAVCLLLSILLAACAAVGTTAFPTGKFVRPNNKNYGLIFNKDGTFSVFDSGATIVNGKYSIKGDIYTDESNDQNCPPMSFKYTFDGKKLNFSYVGKPTDDPCYGRRGDFNNQTYILSN
jgi:hypothetical protein